MVGAAGDISSVGVHAGVVASARRFRFFSLAGDRSTDMTSVLAPVRPTPVDNAEDSSPIERWETDGGHSWELT
jgi:hypothetical protein